MRNFIIFLGGIFLLTSCNLKSPYKGYTNAGHDIYYKLLSIGDDTVKVKPGDFITTDLIYKTMHDSVFFKGRRKFQVTKPEYEGSIDECFTLLAEKDKAEFILSAADFFNKTIKIPAPSFFNEDDMMKIEAAIVDIQTAEDYYKEKEAFLSWIEDFGEYEKVLLKQFIQEEDLDMHPTESGLIKIPVREGNGVKIELGDTIIIHYEGKFLNGKFFDSTKKRSEPFQFVYGQQWQVVKGIEEALGMMEEKEKSLIILPSELAFGESGSSTGIIPPYTSLIFEIEVISVKKGKIS